MKRIFTFGCSFTGWSWPTWADILIHEFNVHGHYGNNFGRGGAGNQYIFIQLWHANAKYKFTSDDTILICWSGFMREDRFANGDWKTPGNLYSQNIYTQEFMNSWADPLHYAYRDSAIISSTSIAMKQIGCTYKTFSMMPLTQADSNNKNFIYPGIEQIEDCSVYMKTDFVSMMDYLELNDHSPARAAKRIRTYYGNESKSNHRAEWHPMPHEHRKYVEEILCPGLGITLSQDTKNFCDFWEEKISKLEQPINLSETGWPNNYR